MHHKLFPNQNRRGWYFLVVLPLALLFQMAFTSDLWATPRSSLSRKAALTKRVKASSQTAETPPLKAANAPLEVFDGLDRIFYRTKPNDTLGKILILYGLSRQERDPWLRVVQKHYPARELPADKKLYLYFTQEKSGVLLKGRKELRTIELELKDDLTLSWEKEGKGIVFAKQDKPQEVDQKTIAGVIETSFFEDGKRAGLSSGVLSQLADIFNWQIDFDKSVKPGDSFKVLFERKSRSGDENRALYRVLAAEVRSEGQTYHAFYFEKDKGKAGYYDSEGRSLARAFLRFPLEFARISSEFTHSRIHPLLGIERPHHGVDFAAKRGTPIRAIGDGKILYAGWRKGGYGRLVELQHDENYLSRYAHMQRVASGLKPGTPVKKGQIIGYVGSTGLSNGAHLHFELYRDGEYLDPLKFDFPPDNQIEPALLVAFRHTKEFFLTKLAEIPYS